MLQSTDHRPVTTPVAKGWTLRLTALRDSLGHSGSEAQFWCPLAVGLGWEEVSWRGPGQGAMRIRVWNHGLAPWGLRALSGWSREGSVSAHSPRWVPLPVVCAAPPYRLLPWFRTAGCCTVRTRADPLGCPRDLADAIPGLLVPWNPTHPRGQGPCQAKAEVLQGPGGLS